MTLPKTLAGYDEQCGAILSWGREGWVGHQQFRDKAREFYKGPRSPRPAVEGAIIAGLFGSDELNDILGEMIRADMVEVRDCPGGSEYRTPV